MYKALTLPLFITLFFHGLILAVILINAPESKPQVKRAAKEYIKAELVILEKPKAKKTATVKQPPKQKERKTQQQVLAERKKAEQRKAEQARQQQLKQQQLKKQQLAKERQQKQREEQARREREQKQRLQEQSERELADAIARENAQQQAENDAALATSYIALITEAIQRNWSRPPSARNSMEAELALRLVPTGEVVSVKVIKSSGNAAFDRSAETAVLKAERFPELKRLPARVFEQYFRHLRLKFKPEDLRL